MAAEATGRGELPPPPLSEPTEEVDFADVRLPWTTPLYMAAAGSLVAVLIAAVTHLPMSTWVMHAGGALLYALAGVFLVGAGRLMPFEVRPFRWTAGLALGAVVGRALTAIVWWGYLCRALGRTLTGAEIVLGGSSILLRWVLFGAVSALAAGAPRGRSWKLSAAGGATFGLTGAIQSAAFLALRGLPNLGAHWGDIPGTAWVHGLTGALLGAALAAALTRAERASRRAKCNAIDGTGPEVR